MNPNEPSRSKPSYAELEDPSAYRLFEDIHYSNVFVFVRGRIFRATPVTVAYWALNVAALVVIAIVWRRAGLGLMDSFSNVCLGMFLGFLALVAIHENIHGLAYRLAGAKTVRITYDFRRWTALCSAPGAILSGGEFAMVCLAPITVLNPLLALMVFVVPAGKLALLFSGALLLHTAACSGDIAFADLLWAHRNRPVFTYDNAEERRARFVERRLAHDGGDIR
jgi:hypothetical protein